MVKRMKNREILLPVFVALFSEADAAKFKLQSEPIRTEISLQHLNRISVLGDKIDSILGLEQAFVLEKNDKTGDAFIRPTEENKYRDISLNVVTSMGKTQDLLLKVVDGDPKTIEIDAPSDIEIHDTEPLYLAGNEPNTSDYEESLTCAMKSAVLYEGALLNIKGIVRSCSRFCVIFEKSYKSEGFTCFVYKITTEKDEKTKLDERYFVKEGDIALSLSKLWVSKSSPTKLYVLRR